MSPSLWTLLRLGLWQLPFLFGWAAFQRFNAVVKVGQNVELMNPTHHVLLTCQCAAPYLFRRTASVQLHVLPDRCLCC